MMLVLGLGALLRVSIAAGSAHAAQSKLVAQLPAELGIPGVRTYSRFYKFPKIFWDETYENVVCRLPPAGVELNGRPLSLGPMSGGEKVERVVVSAEGGVVAATVESSAGAYVVKDGVAGPKGEKVGRVRLSRDGRSMAYVIHRARAAQVVWDTKEQPAYPAVGCIMLSSDGKRLAYVAVHGQRPEPSLEALVVDGEEQGRYVSIDDGPYFAPDGRIVLAARVDEQPEPVSLVVDRQPAGRFSGISEIVFQPGGKGIAFRANRGLTDTTAGDTVLVVNGQVIEVGGHPHGLVYSRDGRRLAYAVRAPRAGAKLVDASQGWLVVRESSGKTSATQHFDQAGPAMNFPRCGEVLARGSTAFSPDGKRMAHRVVVDKREHVVVDGKKLPPYDEVDGIVFSPDGRTVAYIAGNDLAKQVIVGDRAGPYFSEVWPPYFTADGRHVVYAARRDFELWRVVQPVTGPILTLPGAAPPRRMMPPPADLGFVGDWFDCKEAVCVNVDRRGARYHADGSITTLEAAFGQHGFTSYCERAQKLVGFYQWDGALLQLIEMKDGLPNTFPTKISDDVATLGTSRWMKRIPPGAVPFDGPCPQ